mmetsp:Transcript_8246/g.21900  ORF Transcript_8246/g.21900 Transcript_8246/m.21900 type:complete len:103 (+) Transcript_8246:604-912(+)
MAVDTMCLQVCNFARITKISFVDLKYAADNTRTDWKEVLGQTCFSTKVELSTSKKGTGTLRIQGMCIFLLQTTQNLNYCRHLHRIGQLQLWLRLASQGDHVV